MDKIQGEVPDDYSCHCQSSGAHVGFIEKLKVKAFLVLPKKSKTE